jgi:hypothetical protein
MVFCFRFNRPPNRALCDQFFPATFSLTGDAMTKRILPFDGDPQIKIMWGIHPETAEPYLWLNPVAWKIIRLIAEASGTTATDAIQTVLFQRLANATAAPRRAEGDNPKITLEWQLGELHDQQDDAVLIFRGETFTIFCQQLDLPANDLKALLWRTVADIFLIPFQNIEPQGNA